MDNATRLGAFMATIGGLALLGFGLNEGLKEAFIVLAILALLAGLVIMHAGLSVGGDADQR
ncbi:hypothetical protein [Micromonospora sp. LOL_024]|uniref:hypothetical protein n=1 Tax=Micromonospora sp. LOL_024 TaxID=3345412 RepID=UPI003A8712E1